MEHEIFVFRGHEFEMTEVTNEERLQLAMQTFLDGNVSIKEAAKAFGITQDELTKALIPS
jgi:predicted HTH domain antitoxin